MTVYQTITVNVEPDPDAVEVRDLRGEKYLVAPVVAVAEGILNGGFLPFREIQKSAPGWNGVPVTVNHPENDSGEFIPANSPAVLEQYQIGFFANVEAEEPKLPGELWINLGDVKWLTEHAEQLGDEAKQAVEMLRDGEPLEVSTGYWHGEVQKSGEFDGQAFEAVQVDLLPDHLAVLPNAEGACNWDGSTTASGCGAPRTNQAMAGSAQGRGFAANCDPVDVATHRDDYDPEALDATNLLDSARTPEYDGTASSEWSAPTLDEYLSSIDNDLDGTDVDELPDDVKSTIASMTLLGDPDAETFQELAFFPVVEPSTRELNENALDAVLSGRGAQADISDTQLQSARGVARSLLEDEFDRDLDENVGGLRARAANAVLRTLGFDLDVGALAANADSDADATTDVPYALHGANCDCGPCTMSNGNPDDPSDRIERLAENTDLSVEELEAMDEEIVTKLDESLEANSGGDGTGGGSGGGDDPADDPDDRIEALEARIDALQEDLEAQESARHEDLVEVITANSTFEEDELPEDTEKLESMAQKIGAQVETEPNFGGRAAGKSGLDDEVDLDEVEVGGAFNSMDEAASGGD